MLSKNREAAVKALVVHLGYVSSVADAEVYTMPEDVVDEIVAATKEVSQVPETIRSVLSRLYDRRRENHVRSAQEEMDHQRRIVAARTVLENQLGISVDESVALTLPMIASELDAIADTPLDVSCQETLTQLLFTSKTRQEADAEAKAAADAAALAASLAAEEAERKAEEKRLADEASAAAPETAEPAAPEPEAAEAPAVPAPEVVDAVVVDPPAPADDPAPAADPQP